MSNVSLPGARPSRARAAALAAVLALVAGGMAGCDEDNLFEGTDPVPSNSAPVITSLDVPEQITRGGALNVTVKAVGRAGIEQVTVRLSGAYAVERVTDIDPPRTDTVTVSTTLTVPDTATGLVILVEAFATDARGEVSRVESRSVDVLAGSAFEAAADQLLARAYRLRAEPGGRSPHGARGALAPARVLPNRRI
jgi:hypothetical protein